VRHNNLLFIDDTLMTGSSFGKDFTSVYMYHDVPITPFGTSIMYGYSDSKSSPKKEFERFVIKSESQNFSVSLKQDVYKRDEYRGEVSLGIDANDKTSRVLAGMGTTSRDRLRVLRAKSTLIHRFPGAVTSITPEISQGLNWLGARRKQTESPITSRETTNTFTKFNFGIRHRRSLPMNLQAAFNLNSQWAGEKLASQEQFGIGGINSVRGYPSQDYMADDGITTNFELIFPSFWIPEEWAIPYEGSTLRDNVSAFTFFDWGWGKKRGNNQGEKHMNYLSGAGVGLRIKMFNQVSLQLAWGFVLPFADKTITESASSRFHISLNFEDQFNSEFERIRKIAETERIDRLARKANEKAQARKNNDLSAPTEKQHEN
jgi:hemolysin activation/secretion protein